jgi:CDP-paratose 2-epimerase
MSPPSRSGSSRRAHAAHGPIVITGGAGFIGTNVAAAFAARGERVRVFDDLSRGGVEENAKWLSRQFGESIEVRTGDVRDPASVARALRDARAVCHFAAQVAVTTSLADPVPDFETNVRGTLNVLEALRSRSDPPPLLYTSTNKVYGRMPSLLLACEARRYSPLDAQVRRHGVSEGRPLDFHTPYGCSKGSADQYVLDYSRSFGLPAFVFRMSCIYGPHQHGNEDQGWVAHLISRALDGGTLNVYGDGKQVRDLLFVDDLVRAILIAFERIPAVAGQAFNVGGGPGCTCSLLELIDLLAELEGRRPIVRMRAWRDGDQPYYVSDTRRFRAATGWSPMVGVRDGVRRLHGWLRDRRERNEREVEIGAGASAAVAPESVARRNGRG